MGQNLPAISAQDLRAARNPNGNSSKQMVDAMLAVANAADGLRKAMSGLRMNVVHGRNYQRYGDGAGAVLNDSIRKQDEQLVSAIDGNAELLRLWAIDQAMMFHREREREEEED